ncbi:hypothetical protein EJ02DRAFT_313010, partial [Clathrospora elynae]
LLSDLTLPQYYVIQNCMLIASAINTWNEADIWRVYAVEIYQTSLGEATRQKDTNGLEVLRKVRIELDQLLGPYIEDLASL